MLFDQNVVTWPNFDILLSFHGNQLFCNIWNTFEMKDSFSPASGFWNFKLPVLDQKLRASREFIYIPVFEYKKWHKNRQNF